MDHSQQVGPDLLRLHVEGLVEAEHVGRDELGELQGGAHVGVVRANLLGELPSPPLSQNLFPLSPLPRLDVDVPLLHSSLGLAFRSSVGARRATKVLFFLPVDLQLVPVDAVSITNFLSIITPVPIYIIICTKAFIILLLQRLILDEVTHHLEQPLAVVLRDQLRHELVVRLLTAIVDGIQHRLYLLAIATTSALLMQLALVPLPLDTV